MGPLDGRRVLEYATGPAAGFAGLLMRTLGASVEAIEDDAGSPLRNYPPRQAGLSMLYGYVNAGKRVRLARTLTAADVSDINVVVHDGNLPEHVTALLDSAPQPAGGRVFVRCTPYGATGPKSDWQACELSLFQAGGEGYLMPHGLPYEEHPDRPPIGIGRYVAHYQGGIAAALAAVSALRLSRSTGRTEHVDLSIQEAELSLNYFTISRHVEGARESRKTRAFRFAGILKCLDGWVEVVPLENHHWAGILKLLGHPADLTTSEFSDLITRSANGHRINEHLRRWASERKVATVVELAIEAGLPCGPYIAPAALADNAQIIHRKYFVSDRERPGRSDLFPGPAWIFDRWVKPKLRRADSSSNNKPEESHAPA